MRCRAGIILCVVLAAVMATALILVPACSTASASDIFSQINPSGFGAVPDADLSTMVHSSVPVIAERSMYWDASDWRGEACHDSVGIPDTHTTFCLPDGRTGSGYETWTLVQNPNAVDVTVEISYLSSSGAPPVVIAAAVPARSRKSFKMSDAFTANARAGIVVRCITSHKRILVERSMYWDSRGAGTDTIGSCSD